MRRPARRVTAAAVAAVLAGGLLAAGTSATPAAEAVRGPAVPDLPWEPCEDAPGFDCATAQVPTDYDEPAGATTSIALTRLPAAQPDQRVGSLFTNPGGPGGPGVSFIQQAGPTLFPQSVRDRYDIIGFDPRSVGQSDPALCYDSAEQEAAASAGSIAFPVKKSQVAPFLAESRALARSCRANAGEQIAHASTANVARDMDLLRRAVGDEKLTYVGYSYGTYLGATYAKLFPSSVGRMVLDGTVDPVKYSASDGDPQSVGVRLGQGPAAAETFEQFLATCADAGDACALNALGDPTEVVDRMFDALRTDPVDVPIGDGTTVSFGYPEAVVLAFQGLYDPAQWTDLALSLAYLASGGEAPLPQAAPELMRNAQEPEQDYTSVGSSLSTICVDSPSRLPPVAYAPQADRADRAAPDFGRFRAWVGVQCPSLKIRDTDAYRGPWKQTTQAPVLVIGTRHDPATPYSFTAPFTQRFPGGRMLTVEGYGHTIIGKSRCGDTAVADYLVDGDLPAVGAICDQDVAPFTPAPAARKELAETVPTF